MNRKVSIGNVIAAILFGGLFIAIGVYLLSFVQLGFQEADLENQGVHTFTAVDAEHKVHETREKRKNHRDVTIKKTHTYYIEYATDDNSLHFKEKVSEQDYDRFQKNKEQNLPQPTIERSVWLIRKTDSHRYESVDMTATRLLEKIRKENKLGMMVALALIGIGVLSAVIIILPRNHPHRVSHTRQRKGPYHIHRR